MSAATDSAASTAPPPEYYDQDDSDNVCFYCGEPRYTPTHDVRHFGFPFRFQRCACGIEKQTPMPNERFFEWFFNSDVFFSARETKTEKIWGYYDFFKDEPCRMATSKLRYRRLRRVFEGRGPLKIMKIGPSTGTLLHVAQEHGHDVLGCDVSQQFAQHARDTYNVHIDNGRFERQPYEGGQFDVILLFNVIENVPNQDEFLRAIHRTLKPGGHFVLNHVEMRHNLIAKFQGPKYFLYRPPICYAFEGPTLDGILRNYGFEPVRRLRDVRYLHLEKIFTLLDWPWALKIAKALRIERLVFPIYAYPSRITVARKR